MIDVDITYGDNAFFRDTQLKLKFLFSMPVSPCSSSPCF